MKILILGGQGMLGHKAFQVLSQQFETYATFRHANGLWHKLPVYQNADKYTITGIDAQQFDTVIAATAKIKPDIVINCIGIIKQLDAAQNPIISLEINALFPHRLAILCQAIGARLIQISTDCVFSGQKGNYTEQDNPDPVDLYGRSKLLGEINEYPALTVRTSVIGRDYIKKVGLIEWLWGNQGQKIKGYEKAIYSGLTTEVLAETFARIITHQPDLYGLYHVASAPISKYELLKRINKKANLNIQIESDNTYDCDRSLNADAFWNLTGFPRPNWEDMIARLVDEAPSYDKWRERNA